VPAAAARCLAKGGSGRDCGRRGLAPGEARGWSSVAWCARPAWKRELAAAAGLPRLLLRRRAGPLATSGLAEEASGRARPDNGGKDHWSFACAYCGSVSFEMPIYMKIVSLNKMDNFHKGRI
jgi:hypothetical protein